MMVNYFKAGGWDEDGCPTSEKFSELGIYEQTRGATDVLKTNL
jgi:hypothetical protein